MARGKIIGATTVYGSSMREQRALGFSNTNAYNDYLKNQRAQQAGYSSLREAVAANQTPAAAAVDRQPGAGYGAVGRLQEAIRSAVGAAGGATPRTTPQAQVDAANPEKKKTIAQQAGVKQVNLINSRSLGRRLLSGGRASALL